MAAFFTITMAQAMEILVHVLKTWEQKKEFCICDICDFYYFVFSIMETLAMMLLETTKFKTRGPAF